MNPADPRKFRTFDVRSLIGRGEEPRQKILETVAALGAEEGLLLVTPFLPSPLIERLRTAGFQTRPERMADGTWRTYFWRD